MMAEKVRLLYCCSDSQAAQQTMRVPDPRLHQTYGRTTVRGLNGAIWANEREHIMPATMHAIFTQNPDKAHLLDTGYGA